MTPDEASDELQRLLDGEHGIVSVEADEGRIVVYVSDDRAGRDVKARYGGTYMGHPIAVERASRGILMVEAQVDE